MHLTLTPQEREILLWAIDGTLSDLRTEIGHTDNHVMRADLRERKALLAMIHDRLSVPSVNGLPLCREMDQTPAPRLV